MRERLAGSMGAKLLVGQLLIVIAGAATLLLVALLVGPGVFRRHVQDALGFVPPDVTRHLNMAYNDATLISLAVAVAAALLTALTVSWVVTTRMVRPLRELAGAAQRIAHGSPGARVPVRGSDELAQLASAFNDMAASLEHSEDVRRQLLADVAHELRNPLATVESYVEALSDGVLAADEENLRAVRAETGRLGRLVDDLQHVSRAEAHQLELRPTPTDPATLVRHAVQAATPAFATKGVTLVADPAVGLPALVVDQERIGEVLTNLLANALRHTATGGRVTVRARRSADAVEIAVADTGEGIAPEHLTRVFERFYRVDPARSRASGGTGIGLAIVRAIVEAHGGSVAATSEGIGRGATFAVNLPTGSGTSSSGS